MARHTLRAVAALTGPLWLIVRETVAVETCARLRDRRDVHSI